MDWIRHKQIHSILATKGHAPTTLPPDSVKWLNDAVAATRRLPESGLDKGSPPTALCFSLALDLDTCCSKSTAGVHSAVVPVTERKG
eukprot:252803-Amphidinium_carterae.1